MFGTEVHTTCDFKVVLHLFEAEAYNNAHN
jgi:hypothetical protein